MTRSTAPLPTQAVPPAEAFAAFERALHGGGARAALAYLVSLTRYRFIGIFRFSAGMANAAIQCDRQNPDLTRIDAAPDSATSCCFVRDTPGSFTTVDALEDPRLAQHVARDTVRVCCGVPVMDAEGQLLGTLCHHDLVSRHADVLDVPLLLQAAIALALGGHVPPYPNAT